MAIRKATPAVAPLPTLTAIPPGYAILPFGRGCWRPVLIVSGGDGLWSQPLYRELTRLSDGRVGAVCGSQAEALAVIAEHQAWRKRQDEVERGRQQTARGTKR